VKTYGKPKKKKDPKIFKQIQKRIQKILEEKVFPRQKEVQQAKTANGEKRMLSVL
jgi:hypothetical protein